MTDEEFLQALGEPPKMAIKKIAASEDYPVYKPIFTDIVVGGCDHEWVTWTGLHRTVTDCKKCGAEQKEVPVSITITISHS